MASEITHEEKEINEAIVKHCCQNQLTKTVAAELVTEVTQILGTCRAYEDLGRTARFQDIVDWYKKELFGEPEPDEDGNIPEDDEQLSPMHEFKLTILK